MENSGIKYIIKKTESKVLVLPLDDPEDDKVLEELSAYFESSDYIETVKQSLYLLRNMLKN